MMLKLLPILAILFTLAFYQGGKNYERREVKVYIAGVSLPGNEGSKTPVDQTASPKPYTKTGIEGEAESMDIDKVVEKVAVLETNSGKAPRGYHKGCEAKGMTNIYGFGVYQGVCFKDATEAYQVVYKWFEEKLKTKSLPESLCLYNIGKSLKSCEYYLAFLKL